MENVLVEDIQLNLKFCVYEHLTCQILANMWNLPFQSLLISKVMSKSADHDINVFI